MQSSAISVSLAKMINDRRSRAVVLIVTIGLTAFGLVDTETVAQKR